MIKEFDELKGVFNNNGFRLYVIGGTSRNYLMGLPLNDFDFVTDAKPEDIKKFLEVDMTFSKFGSVKYDFNGTKIDITTLRVESEYNDKRHPCKIEFVKDIESDYVRRDFTINAVYIDENYNIIDPTNNGISDIKNKVLRFIGDPLERIEEDPLRILRARRFSKIYGLKIDDETNKILDENIYLLDKINKDKIKEEKRKENEGYGK